MPTVNMQHQPRHHFGETVPYGNVTTLVYKLRTNGDGAAIASDSKDKLTDGDVVNLGALPGGFRLDDAQIIVSKALDSGVTGDIGFAYEDGEDEDAAPEAGDYFTAGVDLGSTGRTRANGPDVVTLPKPAQLTLTVGGADNAVAGEVTVLVTGVIVGME